VPRISQDDNPLYPRTLFSAMLQALNAMDVREQLALILLHAFEYQTSVELPAVYADLNRFLVQAGVLPTIPLAGPVSAPRSGTPDQTGGGVDGMSGWTGFEPSEDPAVTDVVASSGIGRNEKDAPHLVDKVREIVDAVVEGFDSDLKVFAIQTFKLKEFLREEEERAHSKSKRVVDQLEQRDRQEIAATRVGEELAARTAGTALPVLVTAFFDRFWRRVLSDVFIRSGDAEPPSQSGRPAQALSSGPAASVCTSAGISVSSVRRGRKPRSRSSFADENQASPVSLPSPSRVSGIRFPVRRSPSVPMVAAARSAPGGTVQRGRGRPSAIRVCS
jgi:hypothetical protein